MAIYPDVPSLLLAHGIAAGERPLIHSGFSAATISTLGDGPDRRLLKRVRYHDDWIMRTTGDEGAREAQFAAAGDLLARLPKGVATPYIGAAHDGAGAAAILMRDISPWLLPDPDPVDEQRIDVFLAALAALHAAFWDDASLDGAGVSWCGVVERLTLLSPAMGDRLLAEGRDFGLAAGWQAFDRHAAAPARDLVRSLFDDPSPLAREAASLPQTLVHGDPKLANAAVDVASGVVWLFDWAVVSHAPAAIDLSWFPAVNTPQLPWPPDTAIDRYAAHLRAALGDDGFAAAAWPRQRALAAVGTLLTMAWAKALDHEDGRPHELAWVCEAGIAGARLLNWM
jgi:hypothetical protein